MATSASTSKPAATTAAMEGMVAVKPMKAVKTRMARKGEKVGWEMVMKAGEIMTCWMNQYQFDEYL